MPPLDYQNGSDALDDRNRRREAKWRAFVGPSRSDRWRAAAAAIGAEFLPGPRFAGDRIVARLDPWVATLRCHPQGRSDGLLASITVPFVPAGRFTCSARNSDFGSYVAEWIGFRDVRVGDGLFDEGYVLHGSDRAAVRDLFADPLVKALVRTVVTVHLTVGRAGVTLSTSADVSVPRRLRSRFDLCFAVAGRLTELGLASPPG